MNTFDSSYNHAPQLRRNYLKLSIRFRLRSGQTTGEKPRQLYIRLTVDGTTCTDYSSGVYVRPDKWDSGLQKLTGYSKLVQETNRQLETIEADHKQLLAELSRLREAGILPNRPTAELVKQHWTRKTTLIPTLTEAFDTYLGYIDSLMGTPQARDKRTLDKWKNGRTYLIRYIEQTKSEGLTVDLVTRKWAEGFYFYLIKQSLSQGTAARFVGYLRVSIDHLIEVQKIAQNPIGNYFPSKGKDKPIYFLDEEQLERLWEVEPLDSAHGLARDWLLLMCYTGMDQPDLERYVINTGQYHEHTPDGIMINIERGKTGLIACIPLLDEVPKLLALYPDGIPRMSNQVINRWSQLVEKQIGFPHRLTTKICRKTAGAVFLQKGYRIEEVSKILGHASLQTTLRNYVRVTGSMVRAGMKRVQAAAQASPFVQIHKAS